MGVHPWWIGDLFANYVARTGHLEATNTDVVLMLDDSDDISLRLHSTLWTLRDALEE